MTIDERTDRVTGDDTVTDSAVSATTANDVTVVQQTVTVSLLGSDNVRVTIEGAPTVEDALRRAAAILNVQLNPTQVGVVRNGSPARLDEPVQPQDRITAAPRASNG